MTRGIGIPASMCSRVPRPRGDDPDRWDGTRCPLPPRVPRPRGDDPPKIPPLDRAIVLVLFQAGLRRSEAAALEWRDVVPAATGPPLRVAALLPIAGFGPLRPRAATYPRFEHARVYPRACGGTEATPDLVIGQWGLSPRMHNFDCSIRPPAAGRRRRRLELLADERDRRAGLDHFGDDEWCGGIAVKGDAAWRHHTHG